MRPLPPTRKWREASQELVRHVARRAVSSRVIRLARRTEPGRLLTGLLEARVGRPDRVRRQEHLEELPKSFDQALATFIETWGAGPAPDRPVFALSAGWRSGSTLLQRLLMSSGDILIWGEPYDNSEYVRRLCEALRPFAAGMAQGATFAGASSDEMARSWVANLYPRPADLLEAHRAFFRALLADPAVSEGFARWGLKETRLGRSEVRYLRTLFPESSIVLLVRNPVDAWRSYSAGDEVWHASWPDRPVVSAVDFARLWNELASSLRSLSFEDPDVLLLRFEDLVLGGEVLEELSRFTGLDVDPSILSVKVGTTGSANQAIPAPERKAIAAIAGDTAAEFGYEV